MPVELISFSAVQSFSTVILKWTTASENNNAGFEIQRSGDKMSWEKISFINGSGTSSNLIKYDFTDNSLMGKNKYYYRLKQFDYDGHYKYSDIIELNFVLPSKFVLNQNFPNPFNPSTTINYSIPKGEFVNLSIYDALGNKVVALVNEYKTAGYYSINFNGSNLATGIYLCRLESGSYSDIKKLILLK